MYRYFVKDNARTHCARLGTLIKLYVRALKFEVENLDTEKHNRALFEIGRRALEALGIDTLHDVHSWNDGFSVLFCEDESTGLKGGMMDGGRRCTIGRDDVTLEGGELPAFSMEACVRSMARTCSIGALPWSRFDSRLQQAWQAAEPTLRAADIKWTRRPLYDRCENGTQLTEKIRRDYKDVQTELRKLDEWQLDQICILETALRNARRQRDAEEKALATSTAPTEERKNRSSPEKKLPTLQKHDVKAYQLSLIYPTQGKIADKLNSEYGTSYKQGQVSRMLKRAKAHADASGLSQLLPSKANPAMSIDPSRIDLGERTDRRALHQRPKRQSDRS